MEIKISADLLTGTRITTTSSLNSNGFYLDDLLREYEAKTKHGSSDIRDALIDTFTYQELIMNELEKRLPDHYNLAIVYSLGAGAATGIEHVISDEAIKPGVTANKIRTLGINLEAPTPNPVSQLKREYMSIAKQAVRFNTDLRTITAEFLKWIVDETERLEKNPQYAELNLFLQKNPLIIGKKRFDHCDDQPLLPQSKIESFDWSNIGGYEATKAIFKRLQTAVKKSELAYCVMPDPMDNFILLHGPSGTGKTLMARTFAYQSGLPYIPVNPAELGDSFVNATPKNYEKKVFEKSRKIIESGTAPGVVIFIDELDKHCPDTQYLKPGEDNKLVGVFLDNIGGVRDIPGRIVIAATNKAYKIDAALLRRAAFYEVGFPNEETREQIYRVCLKRREREFKYPNRESTFKTKVDYQKLAGLSQDFTGGNIDQIITAVMRAHLFYCLSSTPEKDWKPITQEELALRTTEYKSENELKIRKNIADYERGKQFIMEDL